MALTAFLSSIFGTQELHPSPLKSIIHHNASILRTYALQGTLKNIQETQFQRLKTQKDSLKDLKSQIQCARVKIDELLATRKSVSCGQQRQRMLCSIQVSEDEMKQLSLEISKVKR